MAQKAAKTQAIRNRETLNRTHLIAAGVHLFYLLMRIAFFSRRLLPYIIFSLPAAIIELWFERIGRPTYVEAGEGRDLKRSGEDLDAKGLSEWMWDIVYWTWGNIVLVALLGDWAWWLYGVLPLYSAYLAFTTYTGVRQGMGGMMGGAPEGDGKTAGAGGQSKRQAKMEKRGGQKVQYR